MREIKFRYWNVIEKRFITDCDVYFVAEDCILAGDVNNLPLVDISGNTFVSQYTGLKDKNGTEIYEGDIVKGAKESHWHDGYDLFSGVVKYSNNFAAYEVENGPVLINVGDGIEVIGNIHEHPHLLEESK